MILTNWNARNYKVMTLADTAPLGDRTLWRDLVPASDTVFMENFALYPGGLAIETAGFQCH